jgi:hypothetical protein
MFKLKVKVALREALTAEAAAAHQPASEIVWEFMREYVRRQRKARAHHAWFAAEVQRGMRDADDRAVAQIAHDGVVAAWRRKRAAQMKRAG